MTALIDSSLALPESLRPFYRPLQGGLERLLGLARVNEIHAALLGSEPGAFCQGCLDMLEASPVLEPGALERAAATRGPLLALANHPYGAIEALAFIPLLQSLRPDFKLLANSLLWSIPEFRSFLLPVNPFGGPKAAEENVASLKAALKHLKSGGLLGLFPAGEVSLWRWREWRVADLPWSPQAARLAMLSRASVLPVHFSGHNSALFLAAGALARPLKTPLLPSEAVRLRPGKFRVSVGKVLGPENLRFTDDPEKLARHLRKRVYLQGIRDSKKMCI